MNPDLRERVRAWVQDNTGVPCVWDTAPVPFVGPEKAVIFLNASRSVSEGADETRRTFDTPEGAYVEEQVGWRLVTLALRCEVYDQDFEALDTLEDFRSAAVLARVRRDLGYEDVAIVDVGEVRDLDASVDTRALSVANVDIQLRWQRVSRDGKTVPTWIDTIDTDWVAPT